MEFLLTSDDMVVKFLIPLVLLFIVCVRILKSELLVP
jgi:hypothetical protein